MLKGEKRGRRSPKCGKRISRQPSLAQGDDGQGPQVEATASVPASPSATSPSPSGSPSPVPSPPSGTTSPVPSPQSVSPSPAALLAPVPAPGTAPSGQAVAEAAPVSPSHTVSAASPTNPPPSSPSPATTAAVSQSPPASHEIPATEATSSTPARASAILVEPDVAVGTGATAPRNAGDVSDGTTATAAARGSPALAPLPLDALRQGAGAPARAAPLPPPVAAGSVVDVLRHQNTPSAAIVINTGDDDSSQAAVSAAAPAGQMGPAVLSPMNKFGLSQYENCCVSVTLRVIVNENYRFSDQFGLCWLGEGVEGGARRSKSGVLDVLGCNVCLRKFQGVPPV